MASRGTAGTSLSPNKTRFARPATGVLFALGDATDGNCADNRVLFALGDAEGRPPVENALLFALGDAAGGTEAAKGWPQHTAAPAAVGRDVPTDPVRGDGAGVVTASQPLRIRLDADDGDGTA